MKTQEKIEKSVNLNDIIKEKKSLPQEEKQKIIDNIFYNCLIFILMLILTLIINISFSKLPTKNFESYIDITQIACCIISVAVLEFAYRKDSGKFGLYGVEFLLFSICVLFVPYSYITKSNTDLLKNAILVFAVYYFIKMIVTSIHSRNKYIRENMSDVKELIKEEKTGYIDEESTKTLKVQKIEDEKRKKAKEEKIKKAKLEKEKNQKQTKEVKEKDKDKDKDKDKVKVKEEKKTKKIKTKSGGGNK